MKTAGLWLAKIVANMRWNVFNTRRVSVSPGQVNRAVYGVISGTEGVPVRGYDLVHC